MRLKLIALAILLLTFLLPTIVVAETPPVIIPLATEELNATAVVKIDFPNKPPMFANLQGPALVKRENPGDSNNNGRLDFQTEIIQMQLTGTTLLGPISLNSSSKRPSTGFSEQKRPCDPRLPRLCPANSFFDVFFELEIPGTPIPLPDAKNQVQTNASFFDVFFNEQPARLTANTLFPALKGLYQQKGTVNLFKAPPDEEVVLTQNGEVAGKLRIITLNLK